MKVKLLSLFTLLMVAALVVGAGGTARAQRGPQPTPTPTPPPASPSTSLPTDPVPNPTNVTWFPQTQHTLRTGFREYWNSQGGLARFGYPLTEEFMEQSTDGKTYTVQYFERAKFEWHPENRPPYNILLGLLGNVVTAGRGGELPFQPTTAKTGQIYFPQSQHNVPQTIYHYWATRGGLAVYGYPISEAFIERSPSNGKFYQVQYFERNRLEYHPELPAANNVLLGLLGTQILQARGWLH